MRAHVDVLPNRMTLTLDPREIRAGLGSSSTNPGRGVAESNLRVFAECVILSMYVLYVYNMNPDPDDLPQYSAAQEKENDGTLMLRLRCGFQTASKPALASSIE